MNVLSIMVQVMAVFEGGGFSLSLKTSNLMLY